MHMSKRIRAIALVAMLFSALFSILCTSCISPAIGLTGYTVYDRFKTKKSLSMLLDDYMDARRNYLKAILTDWQNHSEKDLISSWGIPTYSQTFDDGDKLLFFEKKEVSSVTTGGTVHTYGSQYLSNSKDGRRSSGTSSSTSYKDDEITTFSEKKGTVRLTIRKNSVLAWEYGGNLNQLEEIIKPRSEFLKTEEYQLAFNARKEAYDKWNTRSDSLDFLPYIWGGAILEGTLIFLLVKAKNSD